VRAEFYLENMKGRTSVGHVNVVLVLFFDVLLTVNLSIFFSVFNQLDTQKFVLQ